jgi:cytochrome P450
VPVTVSLDARLDALFSGDPVALADPYSVYGAARESARVYELGPMVLLTTYDDVRWALGENVRLSNKAQSEGSRVDAARARLGDDERDAFDEVFAFGSNFLSRTDAPHHTRLRRIVHRAFTPRRIAELEAAARRYTDGFLDRMAGGDVVDAMEFAYRLPLMIVADLLGVPEQDRDLIHAWSVDLGAASGSIEGAVMLKARTAVRAFREYIAATVEQQRGSAGSSDLMTVLLNAEDDDRLDDDELAAVFVQFLFAGHETTSTLIGAGLAELLRAPDEWRALVAEPSLVPNAVEELLRFVTPTQFSGRLALERIELGDAVIEPGCTILAIQAAANRDGAAFPDPDRVDVRRPEARQHVSFGIGPHFCLGASLARLEGQVAFAELARRFPDLELAGGEPEWTGGPMLRRLQALPVSPGRERR